MTNPNPVPKLPLHSRPRAIGLLRTSSDQSDVGRQKIDIEDLEREFNLDMIRTLEIAGLSGTQTLNDADVQKILQEMSDPSVNGLALSAVDRLFRPEDFADLRILSPFKRWRKWIWSAREGLIEAWTDEGWDKL